MWFDQSPSLTLPTYFWREFKATEEGWKQTKHVYYFNASGLREVFFGFPAKGEK